MADNITLKRIVDLVAQTDVDETVYTIIDSVAGTVKKYPIGSLICSIAPIFDTTAAYAAGKYCNYNGQLYRFDEAHAAGSWTGSDATAVTLSEFLEEIGPDVDDLKEALTDVSATLTHKADVDGTVASAEQLLSDVGTEDKAPYLFRATPYDSTRVDEEVVGCSVGWNQYVEHGNFDSSTGWTSAWTIANNVATITCDTAGSYNYNLMRTLANTAVAGHKYFIAVTCKSSALTDVRLRYPAPSIGYNLNVNEWKTIEVINNLSNDATQFGIQFSGVVDAVFSAKELMMVDLTAWFGSTIADYAYTLEQATAGSGVAFIKALLPGGYIPYSAPKMESVSGLSGHRFTGLNQFDEETYFTAKGFEKQSDGSWKAIPNKIGSAIIWENKAGYGGRVSVRYEYKFANTSGSSGLRIVFFYTDGTVGREYPANVGTFTTYSAKSAESKIVSRISWDYGSGTNASYFKDFCISFSLDGERNGQYEPYKETTYALDSDLTFRGILKMDSDHRVYADGDVYLGEGKKNERYAEKNLGGITWYYENGYFYCTLAEKASGIGNILSAKYPTYTDSPAVADMPDKMMKGQSAGANIYIKDSAYTDAALFKASLDGVMCVYEKATASTVEALPYASPQNCAVGGTEEYVYAEGGSGVPVGHNSKYLKNLKGELERVSVAVPDAPSANGTYTLKATVTSSGVTYAWTSD